MKRIGVVVATLLAVQIATAQGPIRDIGAFGQLQTFTQILNVGVTPAADDALTRGPSEGEGGSEAGAAPPVLPEPFQPGAVAGLTINAIFDSTITSDPNAAAIENTINTAIANLQSKFTDPITVTINFSEMSSGLAQSQTYYATGSYSTFLAALKADAKTPDDATAIALLPSVSTNPVNASSSINVKTANLRAVGIVVNPPPGQPDGFVMVNTSITNPGSPGTTGAYNLLPVLEHEIDEVLGLGSSLPSLSVSTGTILPEDLYRYDQTGARTFTTTSSVLAFFSINASTALAQFDNQNDGGDFGDWQSNPLPPGVLPKVQDAFGTPGSNPALSVELTALDVIGYDRALIPPTITLQPANQTVTAGQNAQFTVAASGTPAPTYQWQISTNGGATWSNLANGSPYSGVTTTTLTITGASSGLNGNRYRATATNSAGTATSNAATLTVRLTIIPSDFDGDSKTDIAVYRPSNGTWYILTSSSGFTSGAGYAWGASTDVPVPGDYDGDGKTDVAVYRPASGHWFILKSSTNYTTSITYQWGTSGDLAVPGDYDGDGKTDLAIYRPSSGTWYILTSSSGFTSGVGYAWGVSTDLPMPGDFDGDGKTDIVVYRPGSGHWFILKSSTNYTTSLTYQWGTSGDLAVPGDYDGDGKTDLAIYRPSNGTWYILTSGSGFTSGAAYAWGAGGDVPLPGDYDGDGKADITVYRPSNAYWFVLKSSTNYTAWGTYQWGTTGDVPVLKGR